VKYVRGRVYIQKNEKTPLAYYYFSSRRHNKSSPLAISRTDPGNSRRTTSFVARSSGASTASYGSTTDVEKSVYHSFKDSGTSSSSTSATYSSSSEVNPEVVA
ncbi:hypothetical protein SK128_016496, partial [Halocaridina rubra]